MLGVYRSGRQGARSRPQRWVFRTFPHHIKENPFLAATPLPPCGRKRTRLTLESFGFKHLLWVYSGRRGIHCWISDPAALDLNDDQRKALVTFLEVIKGSKEQTKKVNVRGPKNDGDLHPVLDEALATLKLDFVKLILDDQDCFRSERGWETLLALLPSDRQSYCD